MSNELISAISGLVGAVIGGLCTILGVRQQLAASDHEQKRREGNHRQAILQALHDELETVSELYKLSIGSQVAAHQKGQPFLMYWPVSSEYFAVYHSNAAFIGHLKDVDLRKSLIKAYSHAKALIDSFRLNNIFVEKYQQASFILSQVQSDANKQIFQSQHMQLVQYAEVLQESHKRLEASLEDSLRRLRRAGAFKD